MERGAQRGIAALRVHEVAVVDQHPLIGDVRGMGLMLGVELVRDRVSKEPASTEAASLMELTKKRGLILGKGGLFGNTMRIKPPMCINQDDVGFLLATLDECLTEIESQR